MGRDKTGLESWTELAEQAKVGGFSRAIPSGAVPTDGYMVALMGYEETFPAELFCADSLVGYVARHFDTLTSHGDVYLGAWQSDGVVYLDVSECVPSRAKALFLAVERNQLAVWDVAGAESIYVTRAKAAGHYGYGA